jgi:hypothetical protein
MPIERGNTEPDLELFMLLRIAPCPCRLSLLAYLATAWCSCAAYAGQGLMPGLKAFIQLTYNSFRGHLSFNFKYESFLL